jgi:hypothetical protein
MQFTEKLAKQIDRFVASGFKRSRFTKDIYLFLYCYHGDFIAHYDIDGFYKARFADAEGFKHTVDRIWNKSFRDDQGDSKYIAQHFRHALCKYGVPFETRTVITSKRVMAF